MVNLLVVENLAEQETFFKNKEICLKLSKNVVVCGYILDMSQLGLMQKQYIKY
jgi:hypothetical protein